MLVAQTEKPWVHGFAATSLSGCVGMAIAAHVGGTLLLIGAVGGLAAGLAAVRPRLFAIVLVGLFLFPYAWNPLNPNAPPVLLIAVPSGLLAALLLMTRGGIRLNPLDYCVIA